MSKMTWVKWVLVLAGSTVVALNLEHDRRIGDLCQHAQLLPNAGRIPERDLKISMVVGAASAEQRLYAVGLCAHTVFTF